MVQSKDSLTINAYITNKLKLAQDKREKLLDIINRLLQVSAKNNTEIVRSGRCDIVDLINDELKQYYRIIRTHIESGSGDLRTFSYILNYFDNEFLKENKIAGLARRLEQQLVQTDDPDRSPHCGYVGHNGARIANRFSVSIGKVLADWKNTIESDAEPMLRAYLSEVNDIVLYNCLKYASDRSITPARGLMHESEGFKDCEISFAYFFEILMRLEHKYLSDDEMRVLVNRMLQQMGFRNIIMRSCAINQEKYGTLITEIVNEVNANEYIMKFTGSYQNALQKIREIEKKEYNN